MIKFKKAAACLFCFIAIFASINAKLASKETVIYIVRHAEKQTADPGNANPELNPEGLKRAHDLNLLLKKKPIAAVFATNFKRTMQTGAPVAQRNGIPISSYKADDFEGISKLILSDYRFKNTVVVGHSNTVSELIKAFGLEPPVSKLDDADYDLIFTVRIDKDGQKKLITQRFGQAHHLTEVKLTGSAN